MKGLVSLGWGLGSRECFQYGRISNNSRLALIKPTIAMHSTSQTHQSSSSPSPSEGAHKLLQVWSHVK